MLEQRLHKPAQVGLLLQLEKTEKVSQGEQTCLFVYGIYHEEKNT
jgi:hypothetical protein